EPVRTRIRPGPVVGQCRCPPAWRHLPHRGQCAGRPCRARTAGPLAHRLAGLSAAGYASAMSTFLSPLPATDISAFDALMADLPDPVAARLNASAELLGPLLGAAPYLLDLTRDHAPWL